MSGKPVALVTGGSRGIGAATAKQLAAAGYAVALNYNSNFDAAHKVIGEILAAGGSAEPFKADIGDEQQVIKLFESINTQLGSVSALVNNAGHNGGVGKVDELTKERLEGTFATNVFGTVYCCREALAHMKELGGGSIVNVTSEAAKFGGRHIAHYAAAKAAVNAFTIGFAREAAEYSVRVNAVSPGVIDTDQQKNISEERRQNFMNSIPLGRMGEAEEVAQAITWLLSEHASYVSGSIVPVNGAR